MATSFNLCDEPWLPCIRLDGRAVELGLYDMLMQAHTLRELLGETPLETAALHRLLLAVLHPRSSGQRTAAPGRTLAEGTLGGKRSAGLLLPVARALRSL